MEKKRWKSIDGKASMETRYRKRTYEPSLN